MKRRSTRENENRVEGRLIQDSDGSSRFDYHLLEPSVATFLKGHATRIRQQCGTSIIQIGKALMGAKHYLSHGMFLEWVEREVGIRARTAQAYMRAAQWASDKSTAITHLPPAALYLLSAPSTPQELVDDTLERVNSGELVRLVTIQQKLKGMRNSKRSSERETRNAQTEPQQDRKLSVLVAALDRNSVVMEAVTILARGLSSGDFTRVHNLMTSNAALDDPQLAQNIATAFLAIDGLTIRRQGVLSEIRHVVGSVEMAHCKALETVSTEVVSANIACKRGVFAGLPDLGCGSQ